MDQNELLRLMAEILERLQIRYIVTGSMASMTYAEPRFTNDIDVVVDLAANRIDDIMRAFPAPEYYVNRQAVEEANRGRRQFNIVLPSADLKIDMIVA